jgi:hypothetical protein
MKIAIWSEGRWALNRIHDSIAKYTVGHEIHFFDWMHPNENTLFFQTWESFDLILGNTAITFLPKDTGYLSAMPRTYLAKCLAFLHCPVIDDPTGYHTERVQSDLPEYIAVSSGAKDALERRGLKSSYVPFGVDTEVFKKLPSVRTLTTAGFVGRGSPIKNPELFYDICTSAGLTGIQLYDRTPETLYSDIDILISCSAFECGPLGNFEAAAMGLPVLSKKVGNWARVKSAKFYDTKEEAVSMLKHWKDNPVDLYMYALEVHTEVVSLWNNKSLIQNYLQPILDAFGTVFDFVEIGSADYNTLCDPKKKGLLVEPLDHLAKNLTNIVECSAIYEGPEKIVPIYYTTDHHDWRRGCNKILEPHPTVPYTHVKHVPTLSMQALFEKYKIRYIDLLKISTEGYDAMILRAVLLLLSKVHVHSIHVLMNELTSQNDKHDILSLFSGSYEITDTGSHLLMSSKQV